MQFFCVSKQLVVLLDAAYNILLTLVLKLPHSLVSETAQRTQQALKFNYDV